MKQYRTPIVAALAIVASLSTLATRGYSQQTVAPSAEYALLLFEPSRDFQARSNSESKAYWDHCMQYVGGLKASGVMTGGSALTMPSEGKTIGKAGVSNGPGTKSDVQMGGYLVVKADSVASAIKLAENSPSVLRGGYVEVRPILPMMDGGK